ncbi:psm1 [Symbiodinium sp. CCMP2592]|nr:psm1 [Symbiodinium sp. CCMP2592]
MALLFAMQSFQRPPFLILDEVDAYLDHSNVQALASYIASVDCQAIVISHKHRFFSHGEGLVGVSRDRVRNASVVFTMDLERIRRAGREQRAAEVVRQKEDILARERRQRYQRQARAEEKAFKTVEAAEADAQRAAASAAEALRREEEAVRGLRAARVQRAEHSAQQRRAVEVAAAERKRAQRAASLGRMAQAAKELVRREAERCEVEASGNGLLQGGLSRFSRDGLRGRNILATSHRCAEASALAKAEDARKERMQKISAVAEVAAEAAEAAQPRHGPVEEAQEVSLCEDCKEMRAELERLLSYRTLSPRELRGPSNPEQPLPALPADAESASPIILEESLHADLEPLEPPGGPEEPEHTLRVLDFGQAGLADVLRESCQSSESEGVELPATSAQVLIPGAEVSVSDSDPLDSQSCAEPFSTSPEEKTQDHPALSDEILAVDLFDESTDEVKGTSPSASVWTGLPGPVLEVPSSCDAESCDETPGPLSSPVRLRPKDPLPFCPNPGPGCAALSASFDSASTTSEPRPSATRGRRFGEEDLSQRLDEICRQLDAVF